MYVYKNNILNKMNNIYAHDTFIIFCSVQVLLLNIIYIILLFLFIINFVAWTIFKQFFKSKLRTIKCNNRYSLHMFINCLIVDF